MALVNKVIEAGWFSRKVGYSRIQQKLVSTQYAFKQVGIFFFFL